VALEASRAEIPAFPKWDDESYRRQFVGPHDWRCGAARSIENFVDQARLAWVHPGILGDRDHTEVPEASIERVGEELRYTVGERPNPRQPVPHRRVYRLHRPFTIHQRKEHRAEARRRSPPSP
jgi:phenylpropionate dioxygenase-like ring-hydroxylating dioxygenase large terminal subunit